MFVAVSQPPDRRRLSPCRVCLRRASTKSKKTLEVNSLEALSFNAEFSFPDHRDPAVPAHLATAQAVAKVDCVLQPATGSTCLQV